ncbi:MAG: SulP family inorganic anion transporter [Pseudomonadota bacterium]
MKIFLRNALGSFFTALVSAAFAISFAAIIYTGDLAQFLEQGIALTLLGATLVSAVGAFTLSYRGSILGPQDLPAILISTSVAGIFVAETTATDTTFATIACLIALCTIASGLTGLLVGQFRLTYIARLFPYPVLAGFLATTGLLLLVASVDIALAGHAIPTWGAYLSPDAVLRWGIAIAAALCIIASTRLIHGYFVIPLALLSVLAGLYGVYGLIGFSMSDLRAEGLLLGPFNEGGFGRFLDPTLPASADWGVIFSQAPLVLSVSAATLVGATLNATGLELQLDQDFDLDKEMKGTGIANIVSGLGGGISGFHVVGDTILANRLGLVGAIAGLSSGAGCLFLLFAGGGLLTALPVGFFAAVVGFIGIDLLFTWLWEERHKFVWSDYGVVVLIPMIALVFGFLTAIAVGLVLACALFVIAYARLDIIRFQSDLSTRRSRVERPDGEADLLAAHGQTATILELSGFLFFGTSSRLRDRIQQIGAASPEMRWLILDFRFVTGIDLSTRQVLERIARDRAKRGITTILTGLDAGVSRQLEDEGRFGQIAPHLDDAIRRVEDILIAEGDDHDANGTQIFAELMLLLSGRELDGLAEDVTLDGGDVLVSEFAETKDIYLVKSGRLKISTRTTDGKETVIAYVRPGSVVGEIANYAGVMRTAEISAEATTELVCIKADRLGSLEADHPDKAAKFHRLMAQVLARRLARTTKLLKELGV